MEPSVFVLELRFLGSMQIASRSCDSTFSRFYFSQIFHDIFLQHSTDIGSPDISWNLHKSKWRGGSLRLWLAFGGEISCSSLQVLARWENQFRSPSQSFFCKLRRDMSSKIVSLLRKRRGRRLEESCEFRRLVTLWESSLQFLLFLWFQSQIYLQKREV